MKRSMSLIVVFGLIGGLLYAQEAAVDVTTLKATIEALKKENAKLREENQILRKLVAGTPSTETTSNPSTAPVTGTRSEGKVSQVVSDTQDTGYWLTASSSKRHNSKCRYYKTSKGRSCGADEGTACKVCGG